MPEAAELAGVEPATIAYWYTTGKISVRKTGKIIRIPREAFEQWLLTVSYTHLTLPTILLV